MITGGEESINVALIEVWNITSAIVVSDVMVKAADVRIAGLEINHLGAIVIKAVGDTAAVHAALDAGRVEADRFGVTVGSSVIPAYSAEARRLIHCEPQILGLLHSRAQVLPRHRETVPQRTSIGLLETRGYVPALAAFDEMLKTAPSTYLSHEKIGAAHVAVIVAGEVSAVEASIDAGKKAGNQFDAILATHVLPSPDPLIMELFPGA
jgi:ethanolamine utilization protein EutM